MGMHDGRHRTRKRDPSALKARLPFAELNGPEQGGICNIANFSFVGFTSAHLITELQRRFEAVILDPPTFSQSKESGVFRAEKDYPKLVELALGLMDPGGVLLAVP